MYLIDNKIKVALYLLAFFVFGYAAPILLNIVGVVDVNIYEIIKPVHFLIFCFLSILAYSIIICLLFILYGLYKKIDKKDVYLKLKSTFYASMIFYTILYLLGVVLLVIGIDNLLLTTFAPNIKTSNGFIVISVALTVLAVSYLMLENIKKLKVIWEARMVVAVIIVLFSFALNNTIVGQFFIQNFLDKEAVFKVAEKYKNRDKIEAEKNTKDFVGSFIIENGYLQKNTDGYLYTLSKDNKLNIEFNTSTVNIKKVMLDKQDMQLDTNTTQIYARTDYELKPSVYSIQIFGTTENGVDFSITKKLTVQYVYNTNERQENIFNDWYTKDGDFATVTKDGILLCNKKLKFDSFGYKRRFDGDVSFEFEFTPADVKNIDMSVYMGERTYVIFDNKYIKLFQRLKNGKNKIQKKVEYQKFTENQKYKIKAERRGDKYNIYVNDIEMLVFDDMHDSDVMIGERYRNIGITLPKNSMKILISKIVIQ